MYAICNIHDVSWYVVVLPNSRLLLIPASTGERKETTDQPKTSAALPRLKAKMVRPWWLSSFRHSRKTSTTCGLRRRTVSTRNFRKKRNIVMLIPNRLIRIETVVPTSYWRGSALTCWFHANSYVIINLMKPRIMILTFTSSGFLDWVNTHFATTKDDAFNPYLTFLFYAL